jgi:pyochelin biosynthetic protein PchC
MTTRPAVDDKWIRRYHDAPRSRVRLVCFPHAGGSASYYHPMSEALAPSVEVLAVQYPGRQDRYGEPFVAGIDALADQAFDALRPWADRPFAFFGHSMGAIVAFEVARRFEDRTGAGPRRLFVSSHRAPSRARPGSVHQGDDEALVAAIHALGGTHQGLLADEGMRAVILPVIRNDYQAIETYSYTPGEPLDCPITALMGDADPRTTVDEASAWKEHSRGAFELHVFPGDHFYLDIHRPRVVEEISRTLEKVSQTNS